MPGRLFNMSSKNRLNWCVRTIKRMCEANGWKGVEQYNKCSTSKIARQMRIRDKMLQYEQIVEMRARRFSPVTQPRNSFAPRPYPRPNKKPTPRCPQIWPTDVWLPVYIIHSPLNAHSLQLRAFVTCRSHRRRQTSHIPPDHRNLGQCITYLYCVRSTFIDELGTIFCALDSWRARGAAIAGVEQQQRTTHENMFKWNENGGSTMAYFDTMPHSPIHCQLRHLWLLLLLLNGLSDRRIVF